MKISLFCLAAFMSSALCSGCGDNQVAPTPAPVQVAQVPTPTPTTVPTPTPTPSRAEKRRLRAKARREARAERRRKEKEEAGEKRQAELAATSDSSSSGGGSSDQTGDGDLAYKLATIDNGYIEKDDRSVKRFQSLLGQLSLHYNESQQEISDMTVKSKQLLDEVGVSEKMENIMEGMNQVVPETMLSNSGRNMQSYKEYVALYVTERRAGESHDEIINGMRALTGH